MSNPFLARTVVRPQESATLAEVKPPPRDTEVTRRGPAVHAPHFTSPTGVSVRTGPSPRRLIPFTARSKQSRGGAWLDGPTASAIAYAATFALLGATGTSVFSAARPGQTSEAPALIATRRPADALTVPPADFAQVAPRAIDLDEPGAHDVDLDVQAKPTSSTPSTGEPAPAGRHRPISPRARTGDRVASTLERLGF